MNSNRIAEKGVTTRWGGGREIGLFVCNKRERERKKVNAETLRNEGAIVLLDVVKADF